MDKKVTMKYRFDWLKLAHETDSGFNVLKETASTCCGYLINKPQDFFSRNAGDKIHHVKVYEHYKFHGNKEKKQLYYTRIHKFIRIIFSHGFCRSGSGRIGVWSRAICLSFTNLCSCCLCKKEMLQKHPRQYQTT